MHDHLTEVLETEVVGEVTRVGEVFFDVGLGRICLDRLDPARIQELLVRLKAHFESGLTIRDYLHLTDPGQPRRGIMEVEIIDAELGTPYLLQITSKTLISFYEQRFHLAPGAMGDLTGTFTRGIVELVAGQTEEPLRIFAGYDQLLEEYLAHLDTAVHASISGQALSTEHLVQELARGMQRCWKLIPYPLKAELYPFFKMEGDRISRHDRNMNRTILLAVQAEEGEMAYEYVHQQVPQEEYNQVVSWMIDIYKAIQVSYPFPQYMAAMGRASSIELFVDHFPGFKKVVGSPILEEEGEGGP